MAWTLVTGGAKRLGANICTTLAQQGHNVIVHYNTSADHAQDVVAACRNLGVKSEAICGDFSTFHSTQQFIQDYTARFDSLENLINNVGNYLQGPILQTTPEEWGSLFQTNLHAPFALIQRLLPYIKKSQGNIINIGTAGINGMRTAKTCTVYSMTKIGLLALTRAFAAELAQHNVRVNMVSPGQLEISEDLDLEKLPMHRAGTLDEVSRVIAFLLDKKSEYLTGQNIEIAGGYVL